MRVEHEVPPMQYVEAGNGEPLVLVPGSLTGWISWLPHTEILSASRRVIRVQLHNVALGLSGDPLPPTYSVEYEVIALGKTLDDLAVQQADIAAWSFGAEVALSYAIHHPNRVRTLTLIEPPAFWVLRSRGPLPQRVVDDQQFMRTLAADDITEAQLVKFTHFAGLIPVDMDPRTIPQWESWYQHRQSLRFGDMPYQHEDDIERVRQFDKPVLLVSGEGSSPYYRDIIDVLLEELPDARVVAFPGGHAPHILSMQPFMEQFTQFLSQRQ